MREPHVAALRYDVFIRDDARLADLDRYQIKRRMREATRVQSLKNILAHFRSEDERDLALDVFEQTGSFAVFNDCISVEHLRIACSGSTNYLFHLKQVLGIYLRSSNPAAYDFVHSDEFDYLLEALELENIGGYLCDTDDCYTCDRCGDRSISESTEVCDEEGDAIDTYCEDCVSRHTFTCYISGRLFDDRVSSVEVDGEICAREYCVDHGLIEYDEDEDEYRTCSDYNEEESVIPDYHRMTRKWRTNVTPPRAIGVELEVGFRDGVRGRSAFSEEHFFKGAANNSLPFILEKDGSLDAVPGGVEIISYPLDLYTGYVAADAPWRKMLGYLRDHGAEGWKWRTLAGIHVNQDITHLAPNVIIKYAVFISNAAALSKFIAGRKKIYNTNAGRNPKCMYGGGFIRKNLVDYDRCSVGQGLSKAFREGKYAPVHYHQDEGYIETRIFGSNIRYEGFMACVEYCVAVLEYVQTIDNAELFSPLVASMFRSWLSARNKQYPNLSARLGVVPHPMGTAIPPSAKVSPILAAA